MEFKLRRAGNGRGSAGINIASLVDVLFILLIFVLVSTTFLEQPALDIELPGAKTAALEQIKQLVVSVSKEGLIYVNNQVVDKERFRRMIGEEMVKDKTQPVVLRADKDTSYGLIIEVMDILRDTGVKRMVALTSYFSPEQ